MLTASRLLDVLTYNPLSGAFHWRASGRDAGTVSRLGYISIQIDRKKYYAHRLAWLFLRAEWPDEIDHINGDKSDNRIANLRNASRSKNMANTSKYSNNKVGLKGVAFLRGRWVAYIKKDGKQSHLGCFSTPEEAHAAYCAAATQVHGEFARTA